MVSSYRNLQSRKQDVTAGALVFWVIVLIVAAIFWLAYSVMMLCGILWGEFRWLAPIGYGPAFGLTVFGSVVLGAFKSSASVKKS